MPTESERQMWALITEALKMVPKLLNETDEKQEEIIQRIQFEPVRNAVREALEKAKSKNKQ